MSKKNNKKINDLLNQLFDECGEVMVIGTREDGSGFVGIHGSEREIICTLASAIDDDKHIGRITRRAIHLTEMSADIEEKSVDEKLKDGAVVKN